ncbi:pyruvate,orthophosphate dikinase [Artemisia annua]|uniref:Pyruvate,orthophosphate dikinase n=1 Tax=Artemisia annua TaxID=35608 RepID=A0A2U1KD19_ARTAN|nr:pyruvate,orthophosphate dikinase [Artemisia annua]
MVNSIEPSSVAYFDGAGQDYVSCSPFRVPIARLAAAQLTIRPDPVIPAKARLDPVIPAKTRQDPVIPAKTRQDPVIPAKTRLDPAKTRLFRPNLDRPGYSGEDPARSGETRLHPVRSGQEPVISGQTRLDPVRLGQDPGIPAKPG